MFWNKKKNETTLVWRNRAGKIVCRGDSCPKECDNSCPIWLNTCGLQLLQMNHPEKAEPLLAEAIKIAPDFIDAYSNLGAACGMSNQHQKAYDAYKKALELKPKYPKALFGLVISGKNLGKYDEALRYCNELDKLGVDTDQLREEIQQAKTKNEKAFSLSYVEVAEKLLDVGRREGFIQSKDFAHIPEIVARAEEVSMKILNAITSYAEENAGSVQDPVITSMVWAAYAGMGAVCRWHVAWHELESKGIYETLVQERGVFAMDEYVMDEIGIGYGSDEEKVITKFLFSLLDTCFEMISADEFDIDAFICFSKAMYLWGMVYEMNRLGMY